MYADGTPLYIKEPMVTYKLVMIMACSHLSTYWQKHHLRLLRLALGVRHCILRHSRLALSLRVEHRILRHDNHSQLPLR